ncbi:right-handed parallel beta-helix repeat-containing protein, partial [Candidatus Woesearchaeota archaeon]|nr:right-handed parallel beta-helix repeat-containing protein [Candidatus Woesearchaeota archaeon]
NNTINDRSRLNVTNPTICSGTPSGCGTFNDEPSCTAQQGCTWDEGLGQCTGTPSACSTFTDQTSCTNQQGCSWTNSGSYLKANLIALYNSTFIMKNSYAELFGSQNNVFGSNGFDLNGTSVLVNNSFRNLTIYFYNSNLSFQGNVMNITSSDSLRNIVLLNIENSSLIQNYFWNPLTISAITIYAENNTNITLEKNVLIINKSNGITLRESKNITINSNRIDVSDTPNIGGLSLLRTNISNISYNIISTANVNILFQNSSNNTIYGNNLSSSITNTINIVDSLYNLIEKSNIITGNSNDGSGISFGKSHNNTVSDNDILFNQTAIGFVKSDDNYIINVRAKSGNRGANSTNINLNSSNNKIVDSILNATNGSDIVSSGSNFTYYLNVSFNKSSTLVTSSGFVYVQWYLDVNVTYSNNTLAQNTNVTTYNRTGTYYFSDLVAGNGLVPRKNVTEYVQKSSGGEYYTNYTIDANTSLLTVQNYSSVFNITNNMQFNISMVINTIPNFTVIPNISISPVFSPIVAYANSSLNCTATPLDSEQTTLQVNFTWYKNDLRNTSFDSLVTTNNGTSTGSSKLVTGLKNYDNWTCSAAPYDDYWYGRFVNSSSVQISNYVPQVELLIPTSGNTTVTNRTPSFQWRLWDADPEDVNVYDLFIACQSGCSDDNRSQINVTTTTFNLTIDLAKLGDNNFFYNWTVRAFDNESYGSYAENNQRNFSIQSVIVITIINASVNFSTLVPGSYEDTEDDVPNAIGIRNDGNSLVKVNISLLDSGLWRSRPSPTSFFSYKISNFTGPPQSAGAFRWDTSTTTYASIPLVNETAIDLLKYLNLTNNRIIARVDINITVPNDEPGGRKNSTVLFSSMLGE